MILRVSFPGTDYEWAGPLDEYLAYYRTLSFHNVVVQDSPLGWWAVKSSPHLRST
jgi:hypothetical protein